MLRQRIVVRVTVDRLTCFPGRAKQGFNACVERFATDSEPGLERSRIAKLNGRIRRTGFARKGKSLAFCALQGEPHGGERPDMDVRAGPQRGMMPKLCGKSAESFTRSLHARINGFLENKKRSTTLRADRHPWYRRTTRHRYIEIATDRNSNHRRTTRHRDNQAWHHVWNLGWSRRKRV
jgi:hypothetical protein